MLNAPATSLGIHCEQPVEGRRVTTLKSTAIEGSSEVKRHPLRLAAALAGAGAAVVMGALSVAATPAQANPVAPQHFGGPVNTSIYSPTATLGVPTLSSSAADTPSPMNAAG